MLGASDYERTSRQSSRFAKSLISPISSPVRVGAATSLINVYTLFAIRTVLNIPRFVLVLLAMVLKIPTTSTRSPGFTLSTKSSSSTMSTDRGSCPVGARSGISYMLRNCTPLYLQSPNSVASACPSMSVVGYVLFRFESSEISY